MKKQKGFCILIELLIVVAIDFDHRGHRPSEPARPYGRDHEASAVGSLRIHQILRKLTLHDAYPSRSASRPWALRRHACNLRNHDGATQPALA